MEMDVPEVRPQFPPKRCPITHSFLYCKQEVLRNKYFSVPIMKAEAELVIYHSPPLEGFPLQSSPLCPLLPTFSALPWHLAAHLL